MKRFRTVASATCVLLLAVLLLPTPVSASGSYAWPMRGAVIRAFDGPASPYSSGHRGIDIAAPVGTPVRTVADGVVSFAGSVAGSLYVSIDHAGGIRTTYSWLSAVSVTKGQTVSEDDVVGLSGQGHPGSTVTHLHLGVKLDGEYVDPLLYLTPLDLSALIRLAPLA